MKISTTESTGIGSLSKQIGKAKNNNLIRPSLFDDDVVWDNAQNYKLPEGDIQTSVHPAECAIFVVHGMGEQEWVETAAHLRKNLEDIIAYECSSGKFAAPFIYDGYWANYHNLEVTFPANWQKLNRDGERPFFKQLWATRPFSSKATADWFLYQHWHLLCQRKHFQKNQKMIIWMLYVCLIPITYCFFLIGRLTHSHFLERYLCDVRLYCEPSGAIENAIAQRINRRIAERFLHLIGLDINFTKLPRHKMLKVAGIPIPFKRVVWVSHSLGTLISYNVLSELFQRAEELEKQGNDKQKAGVVHFRNILKCFITMSCPLDKIAYLPTKNNIIRPWPEKCRQELLSVGSEWWINLYDLYDPVSGALSNPFICYGQPPINLNIKVGSFPFSTHNAYWQNKNVLKIILRETFSEMQSDVTHDAEKLSEKQAVGRVIELYAFWFIILPFCIVTALYVLLYM